MIPRNNVQKAIVAALAALSVSACSPETASEPASSESQAPDSSAPVTGAAQTARKDISEIDFGTDGGDWANDGECDDPRFVGEGMTSTPLLDEDIKSDATDCRTAYEKGELSLK
ncbi:hypothetical protein [Pontixanthobacter aquaemixtae]|uniref:Secreted protein n=1 Tax=Pontixanthobacter aquaemixtae TaxID=1958940 RepID=A0A844ZR70_9SPHN|nr:hypothetical protein [Pontixanthobacter aquaemixtae]MXO89812.1 hypothetical protein [Pontixanthobacter aquaemixtae]